MCVRPYLHPHLSVLHVRACVPAYLFFKIHLHPLLRARAPPCVAEEAVEGGEAAQHPQLPEADNNNSNKTKYLYLYLYLYLQEGGEPTAARS